MHPCAKKCHYHPEGEQRDIYVAGCFHSFADFEGPFCRISPTLMGRNGRLKPDKLLNRMGNIWNKTRHFSILLF